MKNINDLLESDMANDVAQKGYYAYDEYLPFEELTKLADKTMDDFFQWEKYWTDTINIILEPYYIDSKTDRLEVEDMPKWQNLELLHQFFIKEKELHTLKSSILDLEEVLDQKWDKLLEFKEITVAQKKIISEQRKKLTWLLMGENHADWNTINESIKGANLAEILVIFEHIRNQLLLNIHAFTQMSHRIVFDYPRPKRRKEFAVNIWPDKKGDLEARFHLIDVEVGEEFTAKIEGQSFLSKDGLIEYEFIPQKLGKQTVRVDITHRNPYTGETEMSACEHYFYVHP